MAVKTAAVPPTKIGAGMNSGLICICSRYTYIGIYAISISMWNERWLFKIVYKSVTSLSYCLCCIMDILRWGWSDNLWVLKKKLG